MFTTLWIGINLSLFGNRSTIKIYFLSTSNSSARPPLFQLPCPFTECSINFSQAIHVRHICKHPCDLSNFTSALTSYGYPLPLLCQIHHTSPTTLPRTNSFSPLNTHIPCWSSIFEPDPKSGTTHPLIWQTRIKNMQKYPYNKKQRLN